MVRWAADLGDVRSEIGESETCGGDFSAGATLGSAAYGVDTETRSHSLMATHRWAASSTVLNEATVHYYKVLKLKPKSVETHNNLGVALGKLGKVQAAIGHYTKALEIEPRYAEARNNLGNVLADRGMLKEAAVQFTKALEVKPTYWKAHNNLGVTLARQGKLEEAIGHFEEALRLKPDFEQARNNLNIALQEAGRRGGAPATY